MNLFKASVASAFIRVTGMALGLFLNVVLARTLSPSEFGLYSYILSIVAILLVPAKFGFPLLVARETAIAMTDDDRSKAWSLWLWSHRLVFFSSVLIAVIIVAVIYFIAQSKEGKAIWYWGAAMVPILALAQLRAGIIRGLGYPVFSQVPETVLRPGFILLIIFSFSYIKVDPVDARAAIVANLLATFIVFMIGTVFMGRVAPTRPGGLVTLHDSTQRKAWVASALTLGLSAGAMTIGGNIAIVILGFIEAHVEVGLYKIAFSGASVVTIGLQSVNIILLPRLIAAYRTSDLYEMQKLVTSTARLVLLLTLIPFLLIVFFGDALIATVFGDEYKYAYSALFILGLGQLLSAFFGSVTLIANMTGNESSALRGAIGFALLNIVLSLVLVPIAGKEGAAFATAFSLVILNAYLWFILWTKVGINTFAFGTAFLNKKKHES